MERNDVTKAKLLKVGDRFYKKSDKQRKAMVMVEQSNKPLYCPADIVDNKLIRKDIKARQYRAILKETEVVYLRSSETNIH